MTSSPSSVRKDPAYAKEYLTRAQQRFPHDFAHADKVFQLTDQSSQVCKYGDLIAATIHFLVFRKGDNYSLINTKSLELVEVLKASSLSDISTSGDKLLIRSPRHLYNYYGEKLIQEFNTTTMASEDFHISMPSSDGSHDRLKISDIAPSTFNLIDEVGNLQFPKWSQEDSPLAW